MNRIDENHSFNIKIASIVGVQKAILLKEIYRWCHDNMIKGKNTFHGIGFTYNTSKAYHLKFPYMPEKSIWRWLRELETKGIIYTTNQFNKRGGDKTKWFTINHEWYDQVAKGEYENLPVADTWYLKMRQTFSQNEITLSQNETDLSQNEVTLPTLTTTSTTNSSSIGASEEILEVKVENENPFQYEMENDYNLIEGLQKQISLSRAEIFDYAAKFNEQKEILGEQHTEYRNWKRNFYFWMKIQMNKQNETRTYSQRPKFTKTNSLISSEDCADVAIDIINQKSSYGEWGI